jgi:hypothetical protein
MATITKSFSILINALNGLLYPEYIGLATEIKCLSHREAQIYGKTYINGRHFKNPNGRQTESGNTWKQCFPDSVHHK